MSKQTNEKSTE